MLDSKLSTQSRRNGCKNCQRDKQGDARGNTAGRELKYGCFDFLYGQFSIINQTCEMQVASEHAKKMVQLSIGETPASNVLGFDDRQAQPYVPPITSLDGGGGVMCHQRDRWCAVVPIRYGIGFYKFSTRCCSCRAEAAAIRFLLLPAMPGAVVVIEVLGPGARNYASAVFKRRHSCAFASLHPDECSPP